MKDSNLTERDTRSLTRGPLRTPREPMILVPESEPGPEARRRFTWRLVVPITVIGATLVGLGLALAKRFTSVGNDAELPPFVADSAAAINSTAPDSATIAAPAPALADSTRQPPPDSVRIAPAPAPPAIARAPQPKPGRAAPAATPRKVTVPPKPAASARATPAQPPPPPPPPAPVEGGRIILRAVAGGTLYLDDRLIGPATEMAVPVSAGRHVVRVTKPGYRTYTRTVDVEAGEDRRLTDLVLPPES